MTASTERRVTNPFSVSSVPKSGAAIGGCLPTPTAPEAPPSVIQTHVQTLAEELCALDSDMAHLGSRLSSVCMPANSAPACDGRPETMASPLVDQLRNLIAHVRQLRATQNDLIDRLEC